MSHQCARKVSSTHLVSESAAELGDIEYVLIVTDNFFGVGMFAEQQRRLLNIRWPSILAW